MNDDTRQHQQDEQARDEATRYEQVGRQLEQVDPDLFAALAGEDPGAQGDYVATAVEQAADTDGALREAAIHGDPGKTDGQDLASALWSAEATLMRATRVQGLGFVRCAEDADALA